MSNLANKNTGCLLKYVFRTKNKKFQYKGVTNTAWDIFIIKIFLFS